MRDQAKIYSNNQAEKSYHAIDVEVTNNSGEISFLAIVNRNKGCLVLPSASEHASFLTAFASAISVVIPGRVTIGLGDGSTSITIEEASLIACDAPVREPHGTFTGLHWHGSHGSIYEYPPIVQGGPIITNVDDSDYKQGDIRWISVIELSEEGNTRVQQILINKLPGHIPLVNTPPGPVRERFRRSLAKAFRLMSNMQIAITFDDEPVEPLIIYTN